MKYIDGKPYQCKYRNHKNPIDFKHIYKWEIILHTKDLKSEQTKSIFDYNLMLTRIMILLVHFKLNFYIIKLQIAKKTLKPIHPK